MRRFALVITVLALPAAVGTFGGAVAEGNVSMAHATDPTHFAGLPAEGARVSAPAAGKLVFSLSPSPWSSWNVYADGRMIWQRWTHVGAAAVIPPGVGMADTGYVEQRLTPLGVRLLRSRILSTGLFEHDLRLAGGRHQASYRVRRGDRMVSVSGVPFADAPWTAHVAKATPAQARGLAELDALLDPPVRLPSTAWAARDVRAFVPSQYLIAIDRAAPDLSKLPFPLRELLGGYTKLFRYGCQVVATSAARAILHAFAEAGIAPSDNRASNIAFDFKGLGFSHPSYLHFHPARPGDRC